MGQGGTGRGVGGLNRGKSLNQELMSIKVLGENKSYL